MSGPSPRDVAAVAAEEAVTVPGVLALDAGTLRTKATYGPGGRVDGVTVRQADAVTTVTVHVDVALGQRIPELAEQVAADVRSRLQATWPDGPRFEVTLDVVDIVTGERPAAPTPARRELR